MPPWSSTPPLRDPPDEDDAEADADPDGEPVAISYAELRSRATQAANLFHS